MAISCNTDEDDELVTTTTTLPKLKSYTELYNEKESKTYSFQYDGLGRLIEEKSVYIQDGVNLATDYKKFIYKGDKLSRINNYEDNELTDYELFFYTGENITKSESYFPKFNSDGFKLSFVTTYEYNDFGEMILKKITLLNDNNEESSKSEYNYTYDTEGNLIDSEFDFNLFYNNVFDDKNNPLYYSYPLNYSKIRGVSKNNEVSSTNAVSESEYLKKYEYNSFGLPIKMETYEDGVLYDIYTFTYF